MGGLIIMKKVLAAVTALICVMGSLAFAPVTDITSSAPVPTSITACAADTTTELPEPGKNIGKYADPYIDTQIYTYKFTDVTTSSKLDSDAKSTKNEDLADAAAALKKALADTAYADYDLGVKEVEISHKELDDKGKTVTVIDSVEYRVALNSVKKATLLDVSIPDIPVPTAEMNAYIQLAFASKATQDAYKDVINLKVADKHPSILAGINTGYVKNVDLTGIEFITSGVFQKASYITEITIPKSVKYIDKLTFKDSGLKKLTVNCQLPNIPESFCENTALSEIKIADYSLIRSIGKNAFKNTPVGATILGEMGAAKGGEEFYVDDGAYEGCKNLTEVVMPDNLHHLNMNVFKDCTKITKVVFGKKTLWADRECFSGCTALTDIQFNSVLEALGGGCFEDCTSLKKVTGIPETIYDWVAYTANTGYGFGSAMFAGCTSLASCELPASLTKIPDECFMGCSSLKTVDIISKNKKLTIKEPIVEIGKSAFEGCSKILEIAYPNVNLIGDKAFKGCSAMTSFEVGECKKTTKIDYTGKEVEYPGVGSNALEGCSSLTAITLLSDSYGEFANAETNGSKGFVFKDCTGAKTITISSNWMEKVPQGMFSGCTSLESIKGSLKKVTVVGKSAFASCSKLKKVDFDNLVIVEESAFSDCSSLTSISTTAKAIAAQDYGNKCFMNCSALKVPVDGSISTIGTSAFQKSGITSVNLDGMTGGTVVIGASAFSECENLKTLNITSSEAKEFKVGNSIAAKCPNLESAVYEGAIITQSMFSNCPALTKVSTNADIIKANAFEFCTSLTNVFKMDGKTNLVATTIESAAFQGCTSLEKIPADKTTSYNGTKHYANCASLKSVETGVLTESMFSDCTSLASVKTEGVNEIPNNCFKNCTALKSYDFSNMQNYSIGTSAFAGSGLTSLKIEGTAQKIGNNAFNGCNSLTKADVDAVTIGSSAFQNCTSLDTVDLFVETIGSNAFSGCVALGTVNINNSDSRQLTAIESGAFNNCNTLTALPIPGDPTIAAKSVGFVNNKAVEDFVIYGVPGSNSETYATNSKLQFANIATYDPSKIVRHTPGDVDGNNVLSVVDAVKLQKWIHGKDAGTIYGSNMDVNGDKVVDIYDLSALKRKLLAK